jgi:hypothetical protein
MSTSQAKKTTVLDQKDVIPGDATTTIWRLCIANRWSFVPDLSGGEPFVDLECVAYLLGVAKKTLQTDYMDGVPKYGNGLVRVSEVMKRKEPSDL